VASNSMETKPYEKRVTEKRICVVDTETDPFSIGRVVKPFSVGFYDGVTYKDFWGEDCIHQYFAWVRETYEEPLLIYAHNGGGFDFYFMLDYLDHGDTPIIINGRLTKVSLQGQEYRDSFKIIPAPLSAYQKDEIDYSWFEEGEREKHKDAILHYQRKDCEYLHQLVTRYHEEFGDELTIGSTAIKYLKHFYGFETFREWQDDIIRPYYFGGRNQCFDSGLLHSSKGWKVYDVNSMYPHAMRSYNHPITSQWERGRTINKDTFFITYEGTQYGAFPCRHENGSLDFTRENGTFLVTIHEFNAALETGTLGSGRIVDTYNFPQYTTFATFIDFFYELRLQAKKDGDKILDLFYKLLMNNSYGKFAQDPRKYSDYLFTIGDVPDDGEDWEHESSYGQGFMWKRAAKNRWRGFRNVGAAASITGASRSELLRGISKAERPIYCDTDSIICERLNADLDDKRLGAWKLEAEAHTAAIAGKKLYALFDGQASNEVCVKSASKGAKLSPQEIREVASGGEVVYSNPVPNFQLDGSAEFIARRIRRTTWEDGKSIPRAGECVIRESTMEDDFYRAGDVEHEIEF